MKVHHNKHVEYGALFMITSGTYSAMPVIVCWFSMNLGGHHRRAVGTAWQIGFGNVSYLYPTTHLKQILIHPQIGGIIASYSFQAGDAKTFFHKGYSICLGFICLSAAACVVYFVACLTQNRQRQKSHDVGMTEYEKTEMGDLNPDYRYML